MNSQLHLHWLLNKPFFPTELKYCLCHILNYDICWDLFLDSLFGSTDLSALMTITMLIALLWFLSLRLSVEDRPLITYLQQNFLLLLLFKLRIFVCGFLNDSVWLIPPCKRENCPDCNLDATAFLRRALFFIGVREKFSSILFLVHVF